MTKIFQKEKNLLEKAHFSKYFKAGLGQFYRFYPARSFFLIGGLVNSGKWILDPFEKHLNQYLFEVYKGKVKLL